MSNSRGDVTRVLEQMKQGDERAMEKLLPLVYDEFRALAHHYLTQARADHTLQPTALVHEAYMKLVGQDGADWQSRHHFFSAAAQAMRHVLVDYARAHMCEKRGGGRVRVQLDEAVAFSPKKDEDVLALHEALEKLAGISPRQAKIVELRFFGGMTVEEVATTLNVSKRTIEGEWTFARTWLARELRDKGPPASLKNL
ncbi:MAG: sigma-70 family RNA polymerase sigma factor [Phycisphaerales bacterium]|nr:sigma-70 family RNA polymerase sigma factor [Phycisphaerales bacterium]